MSLCITLEFVLLLSHLYQSETRAKSQASACAELILGYCLPEKLIHWLVFTHSEQKDSHGFFFSSQIFTS